MRSIRSVLESNDSSILLPSFRKHWVLIALTVFFSISTAVFEGFSIGMLIPFLQAFGESGETFRTGIEWVDVYLLGANASQLSRMYRICGLILFATWMRSLFGYYSSFYGTKSRARIAEDIRLRIVDQLQAVSLRFFTNNRGGDLLNSITNEITRTVSALAVLFAVITHGTLLLVYAVLMVWISWQLSLVVAVFFGGMMWGLTYIIRIIRARGTDITTANSRFVSAMSEFIAGVRTVIAYNQQPHEREHLGNRARGLADAAINANRWSQMVKPLSQGVVSTVLVVMVVLAVRFFVMPGRLEMAFLLTFLFALFRMMPKIHQLNNQRSTWAQNRAGLTNIARLLRRDDKPYLKDGHREAEPLQEAITFENVTFAYEPPETVLKNIDLEIERGKMTAIVGASGAGKSTLVDLIPRFYDPTEGRVLYDGTDLREYRIRSLRKRIAIVSQSTHIFNDTVEANIRYGDLSASTSRIQQVAEQANALQFIEDMDQGFDTALGDRGVRLSGGQRQRISIARALLKDPEILILDEATSDLDSISEKLVQESLNRLMKGRTVIAIAHRLSTIEHADKVAVLEDGKIVEKGTYDELIARKGQLWEYHKIQFQAA